MNGYWLKNWAIFKIGPVTYHQCCNIEKLYKSNIGWVGVGIDGLFFLIWRENFINNNLSQNRLRQIHESLRQVNVRDSLFRLIERFVEQRFTLKIKDLQKFLFENQSSHHHTSRFTSTHMLDLRIAEIYNNGFITIYPWLVWVEFIRALI